MPASYCKQLFIWLIIAVIACGGGGLAFSYHKYLVQIDRYNKARHKSILTNKKLLVIGDPTESSTNSLFGHYGYGDICIDMNIDPNAKDARGSILIRDKLENVLHEFPDDSVVIFESETLEYVDDLNIDYVISEMYRISGGDIYSVHELKPNSIYTYFKSKGYSIYNQMIGRPKQTHKRLFSQYPPFGTYQFN